MRLNEVIFKMDEFYHFGIKGQKWGIRRYQKKDGSLTEIGKQRYKPTKADTEKYGIRGAKRIAKHRNQGMSKEEARKKKTVYSLLKLWGYLLFQLLFQLEL